jgi:hypothetical protein
MVAGTTDAVMFREVAYFMLSRTRMLLAGSQHDIRDTYYHETEKVPLTIERRGLYTSDGSEEGGNKWFLSGGVPRWCSVCTRIRGLQSRQTSSSCFPSANSILCAQTLVLPCLSPSNITIPLRMLGRLFGCRSQQEGVLLLLPRLHLSALAP